MPDDRQQQRDRVPPQIRISRANSKSLLDRTPPAERPHASVEFIQGRVRRSRPGERSHHESERCHRGNDQERQPVRVVRPDDPLHNGGHHPHTRADGVARSVETPPVPAKHVRQEDARRQAHGKPAPDGIDGRREVGQCQRNDHNQDRRQVADADQLLLRSLRFDERLVHVLHQIGRTGVDGGVKRGHAGGHEARQQQPLQADGHELGQHGGKSHFGIGQRRGQQKSQGSHCHDERPPEGEHHNPERGEAARVFVGVGRVVALSHVAAGTRESFQEGLEREEKNRQGEEVVDFVAGGHLNFPRYGQLQPALRQAGGEIAGTDGEESAHAQKNRRESDQRGLGHVGVNHAVKPAERCVSETHRDHDQSANLGRKGQKQRKEFARTDREVGHHPDRPHDGSDGAQ